MERYCAYQERCHQEVRRKLQQMRMIPEAIDHIMAHLILNDFLNEQRFADNFVSGKFRIKKWGKNRITHELKLRQISSFNIQNALKEIDEKDYRNTLDEIVKKRLQQMRDTNKDLRKRKLADYLLHRGWESDLVYPKIKEYIN